MAVRSLKFKIKQLPLTVEALLATKPTDIGMISLEIKAEVTQDVALEVFEVFKKHGAVVTEPKAGG